MHAQMNPHIYIHLHTGTLGGPMHFNDADVGFPWPLHDAGVRFPYKRS